jgi:diguanylate cyclase (GGDEF)-like protein
MRCCLFGTPEISERLVWRFALRGLARKEGPRVLSKLPAGNLPRVLLVEDSRTFTTVLVHRFREEAGVEVVACSTFGDVREVLAKQDQHFVLAVVDLNLVDSPHGEVLEHALESGIPTVVFTSSFDFNSRAKTFHKNIADYVIKDSDRAFDLIVSSVQRILSNRNIRVLVADSPESGKSQLVEMLQTQQFLVQHVTSFEAAKKALAAFPDIELAMIDYRLEGSNGVELVRYIRREHPSDRMRIIGLATNDDPLVSASFLRAGASDFLFRPFLLEEFQCRVAQNVDTLNQIRKLRAIASRDFLTDMYNRRHFFELGPTLVKHCLERGDSCCAAVLDIDHFKKFNDVYGHETGDFVLKTVARKLRELVDDNYHLTARLGGEEFGILFRNMSVQQATEYCDFIREEIGQTLVVVKGEQLCVNVSVGVADIVEEETFDNYLHAADQYLYMAKNSGRNRVFSDYSIVQMFADRSKASA